jgi:Lamin Tail Domain
MVLVGIASCFCDVNAKADPTIGISEINFAGSKSDNNCKTVSSDNRCGFDKWVEISNFGASTLDISGWSLKFNQGNGTNERFVFPQLTGIVGGGSLVVGYTEVNYNSVLTQAGRGANFVTYSMLRVSNNEATDIHVALLDASNTVVDSQYFGTGQYAKQSYKYSLEKINGVWSPSQYQFYIGNYGTPNIFGLTHDIPKAVEVVVTESQPAIEVATTNIAEAQTAVLYSTEYTTIPIEAKQPSPVSLGASINTPVLAAEQQPQLQGAYIPTTQVLNNPVSAVHAQYSYANFLPLVPNPITEITKQLNSTTPSISLDTVLSISLIALARVLVKQVGVRIPTSKKASTVLQQECA